MVKAQLIGIGAGMLLSGCINGIQSGGDFPSLSYTVPRSYQTVYLRAQNQADECLRGKKQYDVYAQVDPAMKTGSIAVRGPLGGLEVARTATNAINDKHTQLDHYGGGHSPWDVGPSQPTDKN